MKLSAQPDKNFKMEDLTFGDLKCIRDALAQFAKAGSSQARSLHQELSDQLDNLAV